MMFVIKRNQVIITALVIMVAVAGYLNYLDNKNTNEITLNDEGEVAAIVQDNSLPVNFNVDREINILSENNDMSKKSKNKNNRNNKNTNQDTSSINENSDAVFVNNNKNIKSSVSNYFVQVKLDREQSRAREKEILDEMINNTNISVNKKNECVDEKIKIQQRIEKESAAESMLESRGFNGVYVRIDDNTVDVVVNKENLSDAEIAQIEDIVKRKTGYSTSQIRISTIKK